MSVYHSQGRRFAVWLTFDEADVIITTSAVDGHPLDVAPFAVLARDEVAALKHCTARAHRFSWELAWGPIPVGMMVLHRCDVRRCVRPDHLFLGTAEENTVDMMAKGRMGPRGLAKGERIGIARLTADAVEVIRSRSRRGATRASLARELNVSETTILDVVRGRTWKHVPSAAAHKRTPQEEEDQCPRSS